MMVLHDELAGQGKIDAWPNFECPMLLNEDCPDHFRARASTRVVWCSLHPCTYADRAIADFDHSLVPSHSSLRLLMIPRRHALALLGVCEESSTR